MQPLAEPVSNLIDAFCKLPGIGPKTATRLTYFLLRSDEAVAKDLAAALDQLKARTLFCRECHNIADSDPCAVCANTQRDHGLICVVEEPLDVQAIESTREYTGVYHVLHGAISPIEGVGPEDLKIGELLERIQLSAGGNDEGGVPRTPVKELLLATNPNLEGEATMLYLQRRLVDHKARLTRLARGLPIGGDLEYTDEITLGRAFEGRHDV